MTSQPGQQTGAFVLLAAAFTGSVAERADEFGDDLSYGAAGELGDGLLQASQGDGGLGVRQAVQVEEVREGFALGLVQQCEAYACDGAAGGETVVARLADGMQFGTTKGRVARREVLPRGRPAGHGVVSQGHPSSIPVPFRTKRALVTARLRRSGVG